MEYCGEVLSSILFHKRTLEHAKNNAKHFYFMSLKTGEYIDASKKGNISRFMNHSCFPNCALQKWVVGSSVRVGLFTTRDVKMGSELTFDYKFERYGMNAQPCYCGEAICTGFIGGSKKSSTSSLSDHEDDGASDQENEILDLDEIDTPMDQVKKEII